MSRVLIIDDCEIICNVIKSALEIDEHECVDVHSGQEAESLIQSQHFSTVFLDVNLPDKSSLELASLIRSCSMKTHLIVISGNMDEDVFSDYAQFGVYDFFQKNKMNIADIRDSVNFAAKRQERWTSLFPEVK